MPMNGTDGRRGSIHYGRVRKGGMEMPTGVRTTMFITYDNSKKTVNQKEEQ